jgi:hypothetical protein
MLRRHIFIHTGSVKTAKIGYGEYAESSRFNAYFKYLKNNQEHIHSKIFEQEANIILQTVIDDFISEESWGNYIEKIPKVIQWKLGKTMQARATAIRNNNNFIIQNSDDMNQCMKKLFSHQGQNILETANIKTVEQLHQSAMNLVTNKSVQKEITHAINMYSLFRNTTVMPNKTPGIEK